MNFKKNLALFFKPDLKRIVLVVVIGVLCYYFWFLVILIFDCEECAVVDVSGEINAPYGYPVPFSTNFSSLISEQYSLLYSILFFSIDVYVWYLLACGIILAYDIRKKKIFVKKISKPTPKSSEQPSEPQPQA